MKLNKMKIGQKAIVDFIDISPFTRRLIEMGFSKNAQVEMLIRGMSNSLTAYRIKNTVVALRDETAENINVTLVYGGSNGQ